MSLCPYTVWICLLLDLSYTSLAGISQKLYSVLLIESYQVEHNFDCLITDDVSFDYLIKVVSMCATVSLCFFSL